MASSAVGLVPITKAFLSKFYDKYPFPPLASDVTSLTSSLKEQASRILAERLDDVSGNEELDAGLEFCPPQKIDENLWRNRESVEEIIFLLNKDNWPDSLKTQDTPSLEEVAASLVRLGEEMQSFLTTIEAFQTSNSEGIFSMVLSYMPQDFRGVLVKQQRERSERRRQAEVENLMLMGGSIRDKYSLLWKQQMERRRQLAQLGSTTGVFRTLVKLLVGVPQVLLDFVCQINDDHGSHFAESIIALMKGEIVHGHRGLWKKQRERYGPPLYDLTRLAFALRAFVAVWWSSFNHPLSPTHELLGLLEQSVKAYTSEFSRYLSFIGGVFENSPFLISPEEAGVADGGVTANDFKETIIAAGKTHEVLVTVECEGSLVAWDFRLTSGKDVGFSVEFVDASRAKLPMLPYQRYDAHQGNFYSPSVGYYKLIWDNSYSTFNRKFLRYKVDAIPPVLDTLSTNEVLSMVEASASLEVR